MCPGQQVIIVPVGQQCHKKKMSMTTIKELNPQGFEKTNGHRKSERTGSKENENKLGLLPSTEQAPVIETAKHKIHMPTSFLSFFFVVAFSTRR